MKEQTLSYITDYQLIHSGTCQNLSLMNGKTGIAVFLFLYSRYTHNAWYEEFAGELLKDVCTRLSIHTPLSFACGLCGIGWSVEFLSKQGFIEGDTDDLLEEIDSKIREYDPVRLSDLSFENGLEGLAAYVRSRSERRATTAPQPFDPAYLSRLEEAVKQHEQTAELDFTIEQTWKKTVACLSRQTIRDKENWKRGLLILQA